MLPDLTKFLKKVILFLSLSWCLSFSLCPLKCSSCLHQPTETAFGEPLMSGYLSVGISLDLFMYSEILPSFGFHTISCFSAPSSIPCMFLFLCRSLKYRGGFLCAFSSCSSLLRPPIPLAGL